VVLEGRSLKGKVAVVTGSTSGIGLSIACALAKAGADIVLNGFGDQDAIEALRRRLSEENDVRALFVPADLTRGTEATALIETSARELGSVDILVNNAGVQHVAPVEEFPVDRWEMLISLLLSSAFYTIRAALPGMKQRNWGRIINIASAHGLVASPYKAAYVSAKHGLVGLTKTVALEVAETNVTVNAVCPGFVRTPLVEAQVADQAKVHNLSEDRVIRDVILASQPTKRFVEPDEVAGLTLFLCSDVARNCTGASYQIDGGWVAR
jgi:3-hydroxybutyrate dehydrogenase